MEQFLQRLAEANVLAPSQKEGGDSIERAVALVDGEYGEQIV
jgi:hypothetical protein